MANKPLALLTSLASTRRGLNSLRQLSFYRVRNGLVDLVVAFLGVSCCTDLQAQARHCWHAPQLRKLAGLSLPHPAPASRRNLRDWARREFVTCLPREESSPPVLSLSMRSTRLVGNADAGAIRLQPIKTRRSISCWWRWMALINRQQSW